MIPLLNVETVAFSLMGYPVSFIELVATFFGLLSVYLATKPSIWTWPTGMLNEVGFFLLFFQVNLYADMLLQCIFFGVTVYGWLHWKNHNDSGRSIVVIGWQKLLMLLCIVVIAAAMVGFLMLRLHTWFPAVFTEPAAYPFIDSFVMSASVAAIILLARKVLESWLLWILVDVVCIGLFIARGINLVAAEYVLFLIMASYGYYNWRRQRVF